MATHFGGVSPVQAYSIRVRYMVTSLFVIICILFTALLYFVQLRSNVAQSASNDAAATRLFTAPKIEIASSVIRIEEGTPLDVSMFKPLSWDTDRLPGGVILWDEIHSSIQSHYASRLIPANMPIARDAVTDIKPRETLNIPPGFRATTITVDKRSGVEGWASPNSRVDVLLTYVDPKTNQKIVGTAACFVKVLSVGGDGSQSRNSGPVMVQGNTTVSLLVEGETAMKIELARSIGELSLILAGPQENAASCGQRRTVRNVFEANDPAPVTETPFIGCVTVSDPVTGRPLVRGLRNGRLEAVDNVALCRK